MTAAGQPKVEHLFSLCMDGKWETVIDRKKSRTGTKPQQLQQNSTAASNGVFAAIDDWKPSGTFARVALDSVLTHCLHHGRPGGETLPDLAGRGALVYHDDDADGPSVGSQQRESDASAATHANGHVNGTKAPSKPKQPKPKPPKRSTPMQAAQALDAAKLRKVCFIVRQILLRCCRFPPHPAALPPRSDCEFCVSSAVFCACRRSCRTCARSTRAASSRSWRRWPTGCWPRSRSRSCSCSTSSMTSPCPRCAPARARLTGQAVTQLLAVLSSCAEG